MPVGAPSADGAAPGATDGTGAHGGGGAAHTDTDVYLDPGDLGRYLSHKGRKVRFMRSTARAQRGHASDMAHLRTQTRVLVAALVLLALAWCTSRYLAAREAYRHVYDLLATPAFVLGRVTGSAPGFSARDVFLAAEFPALYALSGGSVLDLTSAAFLALAVDRWGGMLTQLHWSGPSLPGRAAVFCADYAEWNSPVNPFRWLLPTEAHFATSIMARCKQRAPLTRTVANWLFEGGLCAVAQGYNGTGWSPVRILATVTGQFTVFTKKCPATKALVATTSVLEVVGAGTTSLGIAGSFGLALLSDPRLLFGAAVVGITALAASSRGASAYAAAPCSFGDDEVQLSGDTYMKEVDCG